ncbi:MAG: exosortase system-associated protein, TIGR04073 family [Methylobacter sp.]|nr:MAG: exosortase system-associated protein, TIGR04073 family [Methylobacter sp.]
MKKKNLFTACVLCSALLSTGAACADEHGYLSGVGSKFGQGLANTATGFIEIPKNIINISHEQNAFVGVTWGLLRGVIETVSRTTVGAVELITSPIPTSDFITPPYVWDRFSEDSRYFGQHIPGYWTTYGPLDDGE